jgi:hypothetical protein
MQLLYLTLQVAQRWRFASTPLALRKQGEPQVLPSARVADLAAQLTAKSYQVFLQDGQLYAFKGLAGRLGPIGVHIALLMCLAGKERTCTCSATLGQVVCVSAALQCPEGQEVFALWDRHCSSHRCLSVSLYSHRTCIHTRTNACMHCNIRSNLSVKPVGETCRSNLSVKLAGTAWSGFGTWKGTAMCPEGQEFVVGQALRPASGLASYPKSADTVLQVNRLF